MAIGPYIDVLANTDYVIKHQVHLLTSPLGRDAGKVDQQRVLYILPESSYVEMVLYLIIINDT